MEAEVHPTATVYPGTVLGAGVKVLENAVVGKQPSLSPRSTTKREPLPPTEIGEGTVVSTGAIVFGGSRVGARVILGDQSCVRERVTIGDDVVLGRGSLVENDTTIGAMTRIQAEAYITAYSTLEEHVFVAPCVVTTNDNYMGRTEQRHELTKGPTIRRGARVGGGAVLCPGVEIGEEAFVGAGAVVTKDVPPRTIVVGNPARVLREVPKTSCCSGRRIGTRSGREAGAFGIIARLEFALADSGLAHRSALDDRQAVARDAGARHLHLHVVRPRLGRPMREVLAGRGTCGDAGAEAEIAYVGDRSCLREPESEAEVSARPRHPSDRHTPAGPSAA